MFILSFVVSDILNVFPKLCSCVHNFFYVVPTETELQGSSSQIVREPVTLCIIHVNFQGRQVYNFVPFRICLYKFYSFSVPMGTKEYQISYMHR
jgi:hypothetical protein